MSHGIRALMHAAEMEPLSFRLRLYCGSMQITGLVAPSSWWYRVSENGRAAEITTTQAQSRRGWRSKDLTRVATEDETFRRFKHELDTAELAEVRSDSDELTMVDVHLYPADFRADTKTGGEVIPVARIPLAAIDLYYIISGGVLKQKSQGGASFGVGVLFPMGE